MDGVRRSAHARDEGFTLVELLVVTVIIAILAAIALTVFLNQRRKAADAAVKSDLRNAATSQLAYSAESQEFTDDWTVLAEYADLAKSEQVSFSVWRHSEANWFCLAGFHTQFPDRVWTIDSRFGEFVVDTTSVCHLYPS